MTTKPYKHGLFVAQWGCLECVEATRKQARKTLVALVRASAANKPLTIKLTR